MASGISPARLLYATLSCSSARMWPMVSGSAPAMLLKLRSSTVSLSSFPISGGMQEEMPLLRSTSSLSVAVVEVHAGHRARARVVGRRRAVHAEVVAHLRPAPAVRQVLGVVRDGALQRLQRHVRLLQPRVVRRRRHRRRP
uniref:Uncharacterized protein n=1 Tax=Oryza brachyantha TaxID=4533 RepID=J3LTN7_ORYBR